MEVTEGLYLVLRAWGSTRFTHIIKSVVGIIDVASDLHNGINYMGWLDTNTYCVTNNNSTTPEVVCNPNVFWGILTLGLIQLPGTAFFFLCSMGYFLLNNLRFGFMCLLLALFTPYPVIMIGVDLFFLCSPNGNLPGLGPVEATASHILALECFLEASPELVHFPRAILSHFLYIKGLGGKLGLYERVFQADSNGICHLFQLVPYRKN